MGTKAELREAAVHFFSGTLRPVVDETMPLADAARAHRKLESAQQFGKIVLTT
jgi:NADPH:quinone reductase-like Zn-dependent oxidoreductase